MGQPPGPFDPPPRKSGPSAGLFVALGVLVVALLGGVGYLVLSGDDDDEGGENASQSEETTTTVPEDPEAPVDAPPEETDPSDDIASSDTLEIATTWVYDNTPEGVDEIESGCMAAAVIGVVGEGPVSDAEGDLTLVYESTEASEDEAISSALPSCLDSDSLTAMQEDSGWPWFEAA